MPDTCFRKGIYPTTLLPFCSGFSVLNPLISTLHTLWPTVQPGIAGAVSCLWHDWPDFCSREGNQTELQPPWWRLFPSYLLGPVCPYRLLVGGGQVFSFMVSVVLKHSLGRTSLIPYASRPSLPTWPMYITLQDLDATSCRKPLCLAKARKHISTLMVPWWQQSGNLPWVFYVWGGGEVYAGNKLLLQ